MTAIRPSAALLPHGGRSTDSLLLVSSSFERRCLGLASQLANQATGYKADSIVLIKYSDRDDLTIRARVNRFLPQLGAMLEPSSPSGSIRQQELDPYALIEGADYFSRLFNSVPTDASVVVDISTITKLHVLQLVESARRSGRVGTIRLVYTRARYGRWDTLSWGAEEPVVIPGFGRPRQIDQRKHHLILFCGLEPERCYSIWRRFGQDRCTMVFIDSGDEDLDRCADRARRLNSFDPAAKQIMLPAFDPDGVLATLEALYQQSISAGEYVYIAPMTTKWELIAVWRFMTAHGPSAPAGVLYSAPGRLNASGHTREIGDCLVSTLWDSIPASGYRVSEV